MFRAVTAGTSNVKEKIEKPAPMFLREEYPYKATGNEITDLAALDPTAVYEIKCPACEMSIRARGGKILATQERLKDSGCVSCGNKTLIMRVEYSKNTSVNTQEQ